VEATLEWWANSTLAMASFPIVVENERTGRLRDVTHREDLRQTHDLDEAFTLRFSDDSTIEVLISRPDDDGRFTLTAW
jgi:hypothetical protein